MSILDVLPADAWLRWALVIAAALAVVSAALMVQVLLLSELSTRRERRRAAFERRWRPRLAAASIGEPLDQLPPPSPRDCAWFLMAWCQMQFHLRGAAHQRLNGLLEHFGLADRAAALLTHRRGSMQLLGLACLRHLADPAYWDRIEPLVRDARPILSLAAADALVAIDPRRAMALVVPVAAERRDWAPGRVAILCRNAGRDATTPPLVEMLRQPLRPGARARLLELLRFGEAQALARWARDMLRADAATGERMAALDVLAQAQDPRDRPHLLPMLGASAPGVRLAAVRALAAQATRDDLACLQPGLADRDWSVRQATAHGIATLPGMTPAALAHLRERIDDPYGRDALDQAIAEQSP